MRAPILLATAAWRDMSAKDYFHTGDRVLILWQLINVVNYGFFIVFFFKEIVAIRYLT